MYLKVQCAFGKKWGNGDFFGKIHYFKNIVHNWIILCVYVVPVQMHNSDKFEGSKFNHVGKGAK